MEKEKLLKELMEMAQMKDERELFDWCEIYGGESPHSYYYDEISLPWEQATFDAFKELENKYSEEEIQILFDYIEEIGCVYSEKLIHEKIEYEDIGYGTTIGHIHFEELEEELQE